MNIWTFAMPRTIPILPRPIFFFSAGGSGRTGEPGEGIVVVDSYGPRQPVLVVNCCVDDRVRRVAPPDPSQPNF